MGRMIYNEKNEPTFNFGKFKGQRVVDALKKDPNYYSWIMNNDFPLDTKRQLTTIKLNTK